MNRSVILMLSILLVLLVPGPAHAEQGATVEQGMVARWDAFPADQCGIYGIRYPAVEGVCYYPVDLAEDTGRHEIALWLEDGTRHIGYLDVVEGTFADVVIELPEDKWNKFVNVSEEDLQQAWEDQEALNKVFALDVAAPQFTLPLETPVGSLPASEDDFGSMREFTASSAQKPTADQQKSRHSGRDYPVAAGSVLHAPADGVVSLAEGQLFPGNAVFINHGGGLISMFFHLDEIRAVTGQPIKRGDPLGTVGDTGRATGPHLHIGVRWLNRRIDPALLFDDPAKLVRVTASGGTENQAGPDEPLETDQMLDGSD
ncbi:MAG TPA: M23 family metallopeptidase [Methylomirabilota bacterium]|nr:M23 family metallopeptidase [Methylomirabilota bacterium]